MTAPTNYTNLITSIGEYLHRTDVSTAAPEWITDCETVMNYGDGDTLAGLRTAAQETIANITCTTGQQTVALPSDWLGNRKVYITIFGIRRELIELPTLPMTQDERSNVQAIPWGYIITGSSMYLVTIPNSSYVITLDYYAKIGPLASAVSGTNWLLAMAPDVYRSGAITCGAAWLGASFDPSPWAIRFKKGLDMISSQDMSRFDQTTLRCEPQLLNRPVSNIYMGW